MPVVQGYLNHCIVFTLFIFKWEICWFQCGGSLSKAFVFHFIFLTLFLQRYDNVSYFYLFFYTLTIVDVMSCLSLTVEITWVRIIKHLKDLLYPVSKAHCLMRIKDCWLERRGEESCGWVELPVPPRQVPPTHISLGRGGLAEDFHTIYGQYTKCL